MEKDKIFFAENGLTSTSANYIANLAKESYQNVIEELSHIDLYTTNLSLIGGTQSTISIGDNIEFVCSIEEKLLFIAQAKSLIAWLREAIKARNSLTEEIRETDLTDWAKDLPKFPERENYLTEDDYYASLNIKERNRYYYLETLCAVYGKMIHEKGTLSVAKKDLVKKISKPRDVEFNGRDSLVYSYTPTVSLKEVENEYFKLQAKYREYQAELNGIKHKCELAISESMAASDKKYQTEVENYKHEMKAREAEFQKWKNEKLDEIRSLKIVIPDSLKPIYEKINSLGKI